VYKKKQYTPNKNTRILRIHKNTNAQKYKNTQQYKNIHIYKNAKMKTISTTILYICILIGQRILTSQNTPEYIQIYNSY